MDQEFYIILNWRFHLPGIEPSIPRHRAGINKRSAMNACIKLELVLITAPQRTHLSSLIHAFMEERLLIPALCRGILGSIPGRLNLQIKVISLRAHSLAGSLALLRNDLWGRRRGAEFDAPALCRVLTCCSKTCVRMAGGYKCKLRLSGLTCTPARWLSCAKPEISVEEEGVRSLMHQHSVEFYLVGMHTCHRLFTVKPNYCVQNILCHFWLNATDEIHSNKRESHNISWSRSLSSALHFLFLVVWMTVSTSEDATVKPWHLKWIVLFTPENLVSRFTCE